MPATIWVSVKGDVINSSTAQTGVSAYLDQTENTIKLNTTGFGSDEFITVDVLSGGVTADSSGGSAGVLVETQAKTFGQDASVTVNGQTATVDGLDVFYSANGLSFQYTLPTAYGFGQTASRSDLETFTVEATGGATFQLGSSTTTRQTIGINPLTSGNLGGGDAGAFLADLRGGKTASLQNDVGTALTTVKRAISQVATERGRIGAFQKYQVQTSINSMEVLKTGLTKATSVISDTDYAAAAAELNKQSVLLNSGISLLGLANQQASQILSLLQ